MPDRTAPDSGCQNDPDNQYSLLAFVSGPYIVSCQNGASCSVSY